MAVESLVDKTTELLGILMKHPGALFKREAGGTISAFIDSMAGSLVAEEMDFFPVLNGIFEKIHHIAVISH